MSSTVQLGITGPETSHRLRYELTPGEFVRIGRAPKAGWDIPWDLSISREHADIVLRNEQLNIELLESALNSVHYQDAKHRRIDVPVGDSFRIGMTQFRVEKSAPVVKPESQLINLEALGVENVLAAHAFTDSELQDSGFGCATQQIEALSRLPQLISAAKSDEQLAVMLTALLLDAIPMADAVSVVHFDIDQLLAASTDSSTFPPPRMANVELRDGFQGRFRPSRRLIGNVLRNNTSEMQIWAGDQDGGFTMTEGLDWAFATPIAGEANLGWCLYVSGRGNRDGSMLVQPEHLRGDVKFTELVSQFISSIRQVRALEAEKSQLSSFFSPSVIKTLSNADSTFALEPSERSITVLFCDIRGFSKKAEELHDDLMQLLSTVRQALGVMANGILSYDGTIADFQGDAALGFWGWPVEPADGPLPACLAALEIYERFSHAKREIGAVLNDVSIGMGIAHGRAIAGEIGTMSQAKVGAFGPVVNQGSRLEGMTKKFGVPICVDEATAHAARQTLPSDHVRVRRLARVFPQGMASPITIYGILPQDHPANLPDELISRYNDALNHIIDSRWSDALSTLDGMPADDAPSRFLRNFLESHRLQIPADFNGAIPLTSK